MILKTSWDDGHNLDKRIAQLLLEYELPGIFYISTNTNELTDAEIQQLSKNFEIGGHTTNHPMDIKLLSDEDAYYEILTNKQWLERVTGKPITSFCYPRGRFNDATIEQVKKAGFLDARTTVVLNTKICENQYREDTTIHAFPNRTEYEGKPWLEKAIEQYTIAISQDNGYYHIWGHSWEIEKYQLWDELETLFKYIYEHRNN